MPKESRETASHYQAAVCEETARVCAARFGGMLRAVVLTGSLSRGEGTIVRENGGWQLLGDADFYLVLQDGALKPDGIEMEAAARQIESALLRVGLAGEIGFSVVNGKYLAAMPRHILTYELRMCGQVIQGDREVLSLVPAFGAQEILREDAWRLLANRIVEQVGAMATGRAGYSTVKLCLDMATSYLVFAGSYAPTYRERERSLQKLAAAGEASFPLRDFAEQVSACTRVKLDGVNLPDWTKPQDAIFDLARRLWQWELEQLTGEAGDCAQLMSRWMARQPLKAKVRGWGSVMRRLGWMRSRRDWTRWIQLGRKGSPRYWVYSVAAAAFFDRTGAEPRAEALARWLPLTGKAADGGDAWQWLARQTAANYREFVETTTA